MSETKQRETYYAVIDERDVNHHGPMTFAPDGISETAQWALWFGTYGTIFRTYEQARSAIRKSHRYSKRWGLSWTIQHKIVPMRFLEEWRRNYGRAG